MRLNISTRYLSAHTIKSASLAGVLLFVGIATERTLSESDDVLEPALKQGCITLGTALFYISLYEYLKTYNVKIFNHIKNPLIISALVAFSRLKKPLIISALAAASGSLNYYTQQEIGGSIEEGLTMFALSAGALSAHEFEVLKRVSESKLQILEIIINTGNILGLK